MNYTDDLLEFTLWVKQGLIGLTKGLRESNERYQKANISF